MQQQSLQVQIKFKFTMLFKLTRIHSSRIRRPVSIVIATRGCLPMDFWRNWVPVVLFLINTLRIKTFEMSPLFIGEAYYWCWIEAHSIVIITVKYLWIECFIADNSTRLSPRAILSKIKHYSSLFNYYVIPIHHRSIFSASKMILYVFYIR